MNEGKIYLFEIYSKDFSEYSKGTNNLHTMYFKALFDNDNLKNTVFKLSGNAELFIRPASIKKMNWLFILRINYYKIKILLIQKTINI